MEKTCIIVPAYNEAPRIGVVLDVVTNTDFNSEVIVVDDGSKDNTSEIASKYPVKLACHEHNRGKGAALQTGIGMIDNAQYILFIDADLIGLHQDHLKLLLEPLINDNDVGMSIGVFQGGKKSVDLAQKFFPILNGQRALRRRYINKLPDLSWSRFGVEVLITKYAEMVNEDISWIPMKNITHWTKEKKLGFYHGFLYRLQMYKECLSCYFNYKKILEEIKNKEK